MPQNYIKPSLKNLLIFLLIIISPPPISSQEDEEILESDLLETFSPGAYFEEQDVHLYDTVFPIIFKFKKPEWADQLKLRFASDCTSDQWGDGPSALCPIFYHLHQELSKHLESAMTLPTSSLPETDMPVIFDCDYLSRHFMTEKLTNEKFQTYLTYLKKCTGGKYYESDLVTDYSGKIQAVYDTMVRKFMDEYFSKLPSENRVNEASEMNDKVALSSLIYTHYLSLVKRWRRGYRDCKAGFVPDSLVSEKRLRQALEALEKKVNSTTSDKDKTKDSSIKYNFTIPYDAADITRYYTAPIADCVYAGDKFYIRVLVPVTKVRKSPVKLINIRAIPFYIVEDGAPSLCMLKGFSSGRLFNTGVEEATGGEAVGSSGVGVGVVSLATEVQCDSTNFKICKIPDPYESFANVVTDCARMLITYDYDPSLENEAAIATQCPMDCVDLRSERLPIVIRAHDESETIYIISDPDRPVMAFELECRKPPAEKEEGKEEEEEEEEEETYTVKIPSVTKGVLAIVLSCDCILQLPQQTLLAAGDCTEDLLVFKVLAFHNAGDSPEEEKKVEDDAGYDDYPEDVDYEDAA